MARKEKVDDQVWLDREVSANNFADTRLHKRFKALLGRLWTGMGQTIPFACQDWAHTKAAYRFLSNERVSEQDILSGHFQASAQRFKATKGPILVLQDTTTFSYRRERPEIIRYTGKTTIKGGKHGLLSPLTQCGILMHSSLVVTTRGVPLGLTAIKFWTRTKFKGCKAVKRKINPTRVPIEVKESYRWLENLRQSTSLLEEPGRCTMLAIGKAIFTNCSMRRMTWARTFWCVRL
jgi:hypothetical protein